MPTAPFAIFRFVHSPRLILNRLPMITRNASGIISENKHFESDYEPAPPLYPDHIQTTILQKGLLGIGSAFMSLADPFRDDMIAVLGETTGHSALIFIQSQMMSDPIGQEILRDRPVINSSTVDLEYLKTLPRNTFGYTYWSFLNDNQVTPDSRQPVHFVDDFDLAYVMRRYREIHDLVHTLLGMPTNMIGEVSVKWVEALQTKLPMCIGGAIFGPLRFRPGQRVKYSTTYLPWAIECGQNAKFLMNVYYEREWETPVDDLRKRLSISPPPPT